MNVAYKPKYITMTAFHGSQKNIPDLVFSRPYIHYLLIALIAINQA